LTNFFDFFLKFSIFAPNKLKMIFFTNRFFLQTFKNIFNMKKLFSITASALLLTTAFLSCNDDDDDSKKDSQPEAPTNTTPQTHHQGCVPYAYQLLHGIENATDVKWEIWTTEGDKATKLLAEVKAKAEEAPVYLFDKEGTYLLHLYASGNGVEDYVLMKTDTVDIFPTPKVNFECNVNNSSLTTKNTTENADNWQWDFGDGVTSTEKEPGYQYTKAGEYDITLRAVSKHGCIAEDTKHIKVE
jgi:PKD repeat protein